MSDVSGFKDALREPTGECAQCGRMPEEPHAIFCRNYYSLEDAHTLALVWNETCLTCGAPPGARCRARVGPQHDPRRARPAHRRAGDTMSLKQYNEICVCGGTIHTDDPEALTEWQAAHGKCGTRPDYHA